MCAYVLCECPCAGVCVYIADGRGRHAAPTRIVTYQLSRAVPTLGLGPVRTRQSLSQASGGAWPLHQTRSRLCVPTFYSFLPECARPLPRAMVPGGAALLRPPLLYRTTYISIRQCRPVAFVCECWSGFMKLNHRYYACVYLNSSVPRYRINYH